MNTVEERLVVARQESDDTSSGVAPDQGTSGWRRLGRAAEVAPWRHVDIFTWCVAVLVLVPPAVAMFMALKEPWVPSTDWARIELSVRDVGTADTPLVGPYSRFGWEHPGPLLFYVLAIPYRMVPAEHALPFAAASVTFASALGYVLLALRHSRGRALVALVLFTGFERGLGVGDMADPWNPTMVLVPLAVFLLLCVDIAEARSSWSLLVAVVVGSYVVQTHVGLITVVALVAGVALLLRWRRQRADTDLDRAEPPLLTWQSLRWPVSLGVLVWLPPLIDQLAGDGNLWNVASYGLGLTEGSDRAFEQGAMPLGDVVQSSAWLLSPLGPWRGPVSGGFLHGFPLLDSASPFWLVLIAAVVIGGLVAVRRWRGEILSRQAGSVASSALVLAGVGLAAVVLGLLRQRGVPYFYMARWGIVVALFTWIAVGWTALAVWPRVRTRWKAADRGTSWVPQAAGGVAVAVATVAVATTVWGGSAGDQPVEEHSNAYRRLEGEIMRISEAEEPVVTSRDREFLLFNDVTHGFLVMLDRAGIDWVEPRDEEANGRYFYLVATMENFDAIVAQGVEIVATSGEPSDEAEAADELMLWRAPVDLLLASGDEHAELMELAEEGRLEVETNVEVPPSG